VKKLILLIAAVLAAVIWANRALIHEVVMDTAIGLGALAGLCLAAGLVSAALAGRRQVQPARQRVAARPAVERPRASRPGDPCTEACGRLATRMFEQWPVCDDCGGRLDASAAHARRPADWLGDAPEPAGEDLPALTQPPVIPAGETIGTVDMTEFEKRAS
jgi:hypothetical protein